MTGITPAVVDVSGGNLVLVIVVALIALGALAMAAMFRQEVLAAGEGTDNMKNIAQAVQEGANAYLQRQFRTLAVFAAIAFFLLLALPADDWVGPDLPLGLLPGRCRVLRRRSATSACRWPCGPTSGWPRPPTARAATRRCRSASAPAARSAWPPSASACSAPASSSSSSRTRRPHVLEGFGFGAALLAMFMRVGGGIFTKAADVGADLVGKVEQNIPEDDPRNAATIADNVGDNVGDCAGMAADLFESYAVTLVAALILGSPGVRRQGPGLPAARPRHRRAHRGRRRLPQPAAGRRERPDHDQPGVLHLRRHLRGACVVAAFVYLPTSFAELQGGTGENLLDRSSAARSPTATRR